MSSTRLKKAMNLEEKDEFKRFTKFTTCSKGYRPTKDLAETKPGVIKPSRKMSRAYIPGLLKPIPKGTFRSSDII